MVEHNEEKEKVRKFAQRYAKVSGFKLNPDVRTVELVIEGLVRNRIKYGRQYCPCRIVTGNAEEDRQKICPCVWHREEIEKIGHCHCDLFHKG
jgi:ferredoxin-thioredoxin reductase catalytic subunit